MLNLVGEKVSHNTFGEGVILDVSSNQVLIMFGNKKIPFDFPSVFNGPAVILNEDVQSEIQRVYSTGDPVAKNSSLIMWDEEIESIIQQIITMLNKVFAGKGYHAERIPSQGEKGLNIYPSDSKNRVAFIYPKRRIQKLDFGISTEVHSRLEKEISMTADIDVKPGKYPGWRKLPQIDLEELLSICDKL